MRARESARERDATARCIEQAWKDFGKDTHLN
jgi:hypothetical protein